MIATRPARKPKYFKPKAEAVKVYQDGREVCNQETEAGRKEYKRRLHLMISRQLNRCAKCLKPKNDLQFDHALGRGLSGAHRDDRIWTPEGEVMNAALCSICNNEKGSKRYAWQDGVYAPI